MMSSKQNGMRQAARVIVLAGRSYFSSALGASPVPNTSRSAAAAANTCVTRPNLTIHHLAPGTSSSSSNFAVACRRGIATSSPAARPPGATVRASMENVETMTMSDAEIRALGAKKRPPGEHPGGPLHQQGRLSGWFKPELRALYPLFAMLSLGLSLAVWNMARELYKNPAVMVNKNRRQHMLFEIDDPQTIVKESEKYHNDNALKKLAYKEGGVVGFTKRTSFEPPHLPGDDTPVIGRAQGSVSTRP